MNKFYQIISIFQGEAIRLISDMLLALNPQKGDQVIFSFPNKGAHLEAIFFPFPVSQVHVSSSLLLCSQSPILIHEKDIAHPL